jgi:hypothetical protein
LNALRAVVVCLAAAGPISWGWAGAPPAPHPEETGNPPRLTFTKELKGSVPECVTLSVTTDGAALYEGRPCSDPPNPRSFKLSPATTRRLFDLAAQLDNFKSMDLESHKKVANLGLKTFTYENGAEKNQVQFNYTLRREAQELSDLCERISSVQQHVMALEYLMKYDHLGLPKELRQIQIDLDNHALADPEIMGPTLERIARNPKLLHLAQSRAEDILQRLHLNN